MPVSYTHLDVYKRQMIHDVSCLYFKVSIKRVRPQMYVHDFMSLLQSKHKSDRNTSYVSSVILHEIVIFVKRKTHFDQIYFAFISPLRRQKRSVNGPLYITTQIFQRCNIAIITDTMDTGHFGCVKMCIRDSRPGDYEASDGVIIQ